MNLWEETHHALSNGKWSEARRCLDDLAREQVTDRLLDLKSYQRLCKKTLPEGFHAVLQDRIDLVNSKVQPKPQDPEVAYIAEKSDPSIAVVVRQAQQANPQRRMLGIALPENPRPFVTPYAWR